MNENTEMVAMAKKPKRGRPKSLHPRFNQLMVRLDAAERKALNRYAKQQIITPSAAMRKIMVERFRQDGILQTPE